MNKKKNKEWMDENEEYKWMCNNLLSAENVSYAISDGVTLIIDYNSDASLILRDDLDLLCRCLHFIILLF